MKRLALTTTIACLLSTPLAHANVKIHHNPAGFLDATNPAIEKETPDIYFSADEIESNQELGTISAIGNVNIVRSNITIKADKITFNQREDVLTATGNVIMLEENGNVVFADNITLSDRMSQGEMENIKVVLTDQSRLWARSAKRYKNDLKVMRRAIYTPCDSCEGERPLWQLNAQKVTHNVERQNINYSHAVLRVKDVPVMYTPYLSHPDPTVKRRSGFTIPVFRSNNYLGASLQPGYFWDISDHEDLMLSPIFSTKHDIIPMGSYRKYFYSGELEVSGSIVDDKDKDRVRGNLFVRGRHEVNDFWYADADIRHASDGAYLKDLSLRYRDDSWLTSRVGLQGFDNRNYASVEAYHYKLISYDLRNPNRPYVVPIMSYENISDPMAYGSYAKNTFGFASVYHDGNQNSQRATMINSWVLPYTSPYGQRYRLQASNKMDLYYVNDYAYREDEFTGTVTRVFPQLGLEWKYPFVKASERSRQILEPTVVAIAAPDGGNKRDRIPNEDSLYRSFDDTNVLSLDRYTGYDRNDSGSRISYGLNWNAYGERTGRTAAFVAQSYKFRGNDRFIPDNDINKLSDYVGRVYARPNNLLDLTYRFKADKDNFELKYSDLSAQVGPRILNAYIAYIYLQNDPSATFQGYNERKELYTSLNSRLTRDWSIEIYNRQDLTKGGGNLEYGGALTYEDECLRIVTNLKRQNSNDPEFRGGFEISATVFLKTIGGVGSK
jgi:LPS-assembly protein